jgi:hypothetical protein
MSSILQYGYPEIPKSVTNPNVLEVNALDVGSPMSFLLFIKTISVSFEPEILQAYYNEYIKRWNTKKKNSDSVNSNMIIEKYRDFIRDINIKYTTLEERDFLQKLNFNDRYDLDTVLGFYSKKLLEISQYYNTKRDDVKYEITRKKLKGSNLGLEKTVLEKTIEFLENQEYGLIEYDIDDIKSKIKIDIQELYNSYGLYFDQKPDIKIYDYKDLDFGQDIFLRNDDDLIASVFSGVSDEIKTLKEADQLFENKRKLTRKSVSSNFYYISTGSTSTDFVSGKLFDATNSSKNILNRNNPTTASTIKGGLLTKENVGFFKPSKTGIVFIDGKNESFSINIDALQPNSLYYFPDPNIFGSNGEILTFFVDGEYLKRNASSSEAVNQPISNKNDTKYYGYATLKTDEFDQSFESIFDSGYIADQKSDVFGNRFGLFKLDDSFKSTIQVKTPNNIKSLLLNGYKFFDDLYGEGYNFNYTIADSTSYTETLRSGISSNTNSFSSTAGAWNLFFRNFTPYQELISPTESSITPSFKIRDGAIFMKNDVEFLSDPSSSDLNAFPGASVYYYNTLFDAGIYTASPIQRALKDTSFPANTANFLQSVRPLSGNDVLNVDGGKFTTEFVYNYTFDEVDYAYINDSSNATSFVIDDITDSNYNDRLDLNGQIFVKNINYNSTRPLLTEFSYLSSKYNGSVVAQLSSISKFEIAYNTISIETDNYLIFEKIRYENSKFINPKTAAYVIEHDTTDVNKLSNRFKIGTDIYYCVLNSTTPFISSNNYIVYPEIYKYDTLTDVNLKIFPINETDYTSNEDFFNVSGNNVRFDKIESPVLVYTDTNKIFSISFLAKDQNEMIALHEYDFIINPDVTFLKHHVYMGSFDSYSNIMSSSYSSLSNVYLQSTPAANVINQEFIL